METVNGGGGVKTGREEIQTADKRPAVLLQQETHHLLPLWAGRCGSQDPSAQLNIFWLRALILKSTRNKVRNVRRVNKHRNIYLSINYH